ncbi:olfactory receptor 5AK2-like [Bos indicus x Bos taurus]|uniref:olfactory receptor 5AK2-like n=1 Tax=Bos indicus x Bos taurus TaxID=30522 RepID=UPI000F7D528B|nr:olfactory receptor 5AK2-like [Bos indicus x Bos taurus]
MELFVLITSRNSTEVTEFFLLGFGVQYEFQYFLFTVFLVIYGTSMVGIIGMILLIKIDSRLQTPMYFFLQHLAFVDICFTSVVTPKMMQNFIIENKSISFKGCVVQLLVYTTFVTGDCYLLAATAVDHYVAVCNPLHYPTIMSRRVCIQLVAGSYIMGSINASVHTGFTFSLVFCKGNTINHFFCDIPPVLALSCSNTDINIMLIFAFVGFNLTSTVLAIIVSYMFILAAILKISSNAGKKKAFSTCASHLTAVTIFYGTLSYMYLQSYSHNSHENRKVASVFYGIVIPMLNPLIYSLRNKEVKEALKVIWKKFFFRLDPKC